MNTLSCFSALDTIQYSPTLTPEEFCATQPCVHITAGQKINFILIQPTSTIIVYVLGLLWLAAAVYFWRTRGQEKSRLWWTAALLTGGVAAILAGTSYQAFGYEIKCAGRAICTWTSWWEVAYLMFQALSMDAMLVALSYSCATGRLRTALNAYAAINAAAYLTLTTIGALVPIKFLVSFELIVLFSGPNLLLFLIIAGTRYIRHKTPLDLTLLGAGGWLMLTIAAYFAYMMAGITQTIWARGIWFSENDVLHIFMIAWIIYIPLALGKLVKDTE